MTDPVKHVSYQLNICYITTITIDYITKKIIGVVRSICKTLFFKVRTPVFWCFLPHPVSNYGHNSLVCKIMYRTVYT